jgi:hydrophobic/amphiphilic exporter-1 (mainly G- bacteria), HAE1 family
MFLSDLSIKQPVFATMMMAGLVVLGIFSYRELSIDLFPDVDIPVITVQTLYPGVAPETIETEVTKRIEEVVNPIEGVDHITSVSTEGVSSVVIEFELGTNIHTAAQDVRSKVSALRREFPAEVEEPVIQRMDPADQPIISLSVSSSYLTPKQLTSLTEKYIKKRLETIEGVGKLDIIGGQRREIQVHLDLVRMKQFNLTVPEIVGVLQRENLEVPAGKISQGPIEELVRVTGKVEDPARFRDLIVKNVGGRPIFLNEVAVITDSHEEQRTLALVNNNRALALDIRKQSGSNTVDMADKIKAELPKLNRELPGETTVTVVKDLSVFIRDSVTDVKDTLILGAIFTVMVVFVFLNSWRSTVITGLTLPISIIAAFIAMRFMGFTLNQMTLMGLSLAIGLLIDDAIVVRENIVRHMQHGRSHMEAASIGTSEIGLAVMATTFSVLAVFVPVAFMKGIVGQFFFEFGITVASAVAVSLFVSFTMDPMLSSRWFDPAIEQGIRRRGLARVLEIFDRYFQHLHVVYERAIAFSLRHRALVLAAALLLFAASLASFPLLGSEFFPDYDQGEFQIGFKTAAGTSIEETEDVAREIIAKLSRQPGIDYTFTTIGAGQSAALNEGITYIKLKPKEQRDLSFNEIKKRIRADLASMGRARTSVEQTGGMGDAKPIQISVRGTDLEALDRLSSQVADIMQAVPGAVDVDRSLDRQKPEVKVQLDRKIASDLGISLNALATTMRVLLNGQVATQFEDADGDAYDVRVRLANQERRSLDRINEVEVLSSKKDARGKDILVPLGQMIQFQRGGSASEIRRMDLVREVRISANTMDRPLGDVLEEIQQRCQAISLPAGFNIVYTGEAEIMMESFRYIYDALILAVVFIYLILASQFGSFTHPLSIMLSLPLSLVGVVGMLWLTQDTLNIMSLIGLILLMGLVTKNAILLIDCCNRLRREGMDRDLALAKAGGTRFRPIVMTTLAMIFGMAPLAFEIGAGSEMRAPMARAVIGGLITSTLLTLVAVPVMYSLLDGLSARMLRVFHRRPHSAQNPVSP